MLNFMGDIGRSDGNWNRFDGIKEWTRRGFPGVIMKVKQTNKYLYKIK